MVVHVSLTEILFLYIPIGTIIIYYLYQILKELLSNLYKSHSKKYKDCTKCKNWYLSGVSGSGGYCYYKCRKHEDISLDTNMNMNNATYYNKCNDFENKE